MANKSSSIARKLWLANGSAVLAIASLFSIGFAAWAEVGKDSTAYIDGININVSNHGAKMLAFDYETFYLYDTGIMQNQNDVEYTSTPYLSFLAVFEIKQADVNRPINCTFELTCPTGFSPGITLYKDSAGKEQSANYKCKPLFFSSTINKITSIDVLLKDNTFMSTDFTFPQSGETYTFNNTQTLSTDAYLHVYIEWNVNIPANYVDFFDTVSSLSSLTFGLDIGAEVA